MDDIDLTEVRSRVAGVALLDAVGVIVAANEGWNVLTDGGNGSPAEGYGVGGSLLEACDRDVNQPQTAAAIRAALSGDLGPTEVVDVPCRPDDQSRWSAVTVAARLNEAGTPVGATVTLSPVTEPSDSEHERASGWDDLRFSSALSLVKTAMAEATSMVEIYDAVAEGARLIADCHTAIVNVAEDNGEAVVTVGATGSGSQALLGTRMPVDQCLSGSVIRTGQPVIVAGHTRDGGVGPTLVVPVMRNDANAFGVVAVSNEVGGPTFSASCLAELTRFAHLAALDLQLASRLRLPGAGMGTAGLGPQAVAALSNVDDIEVAWAMVEASPDALVMTDDRGLIELVNSQTEVLFGHNRAELLGRPAEILLPDRFAQAHTAHRTRFRAAPEVRTMGSGLDLRARRADGTEFAVEVSLAPLQIQGQLLILAAVRDVSDRVKTESRARLIQSTIDATHDGVFMFGADNEMQFTYVNQGAIDQTGYSRTELLSMTPLHIKPEFTQASFQETVRPLINDEVSRLTFTTIHRRKDGRDVPVEIILEYPPATEASPERVMVALVRNITERVEAAKIRAREQALGTALSDVRLAMLQGASRLEGIRLICERAHSTLDASVAMILTPTGIDDELGIEAAVGLDDDIKSRLSFRTSVGVVGQVYATGHAEFSGDGDPRIPRANASVVDEYRAGSIVMAPLHGADHIFGVLTIVRTGEVEPFNEHDLVAIEQFATAAAGAIELAENRDIQNRLDLFEDRERIGRDMHDKVIGRLFATGMTMQATLSQIAEPHTKERLSGAVNEIDNAIKEIRTAVFGLRAGIDWGRGIKGEVLALAADLNDPLGFEPHVSLNGPIDDLPGHIVDDLLATLREALTNIVKYAQPSIVKIAVSVDAASLHLQVDDNGVGFDSSDGDTATSADAQLAGKGLTNITHRAQALGGHATVTSSPGNGTTIDWTVPLPETVS